MERYQEVIQPGREEEKRRRGGEEEERSWMEFSAAGSDPEVRGAAAGSRDV